MHFHFIHLAKIVFVFMCVCSLNWVRTYKVQFSNDSSVWQPCMNGSQEAVSLCFISNGNLLLSALPHRVFLSEFIKVEEHINL